MANNFHAFIFYYLNSGRKASTLSKEAQTFLPPATFSSSTQASQNK